MSLIYSSESDSSEDEVVYAAVNRKKRVAAESRGKPRGVKTKTPRSNDEGRTQTPDNVDELSMVPPNEDLPNVDPQWNYYNEVDPEDPNKMVAMAFCCAHCKCDDEKRGLHNNRLSTSGDSGYFHRHCCHNLCLEEVDEDWEPPLLWYAVNGQAEVPKEEVFAESELKRKVANAARKETEAKNQDEWEDPTSMLLSYPPYVKTLNEHKQEVERRVGNLKPAVVIDAFGGIGAALVALKRLEIAISKVIHIEHDMVAMHVARHCHDGSYNKGLPHNEIQEHIYEPKFENIVTNLDNFMSKHGPIDIIIGGPPCADFSGLNAYGAGTKGAQGQLLPKFGELINAIQAHKEQQNKPLFFLVENVVFCKEAFDNYNVVEKAIGTTHTIWDAKYFSPCQRKRSYWLNFPMNSVACGYEEAAKISPSSCLEEGWSMVGTSEKFDKANTFLASKMRLDSDSMLKMKAKGRKRYIKGYYSVLERERMLGFPDGYVKKAVDYLFKTLLHDGLARVTAETDPWSAFLDKKFLSFSGEEFKYGKDQHGDLYLKMSPPTINLNREFFSADHYAKHLLGNSFSIPVVEHLLTHLKPLFASRKYAGYNYKYCWDEQKSE